MTGEWVDDLPGVDAGAPIEWSLTGAGQLGTTNTLICREAAAVLGVHPGSVNRMARSGRIRGVRVGGSWLLDRASVVAYRDEIAERAAAPPPRELPAEPLLRLVDGRGGPRALGLARGSADEMALYRARRSGRLTVVAADRLAVGLLGLTPWEVWGTDCYAT